MSEEKQVDQEAERRLRRPQNQEASIPSSGGGTGPVSGIGGMSPAERVQYIQEIQKMSPIARISDAVKKNLKLENFGLDKGLFANRAALFNGIKATYEQLRGKNPAQMNQRIAGLTENVRGVERIKHEMSQGANVDLLDYGKSVKDKGYMVDSSWTPKKNGEVE